MLLSPRKEVVVPTRSVRPIFFTSVVGTPSGVLLTVEVAIAHYFYPEPLGQSVDRGYADSMQPAGDLVAISAEFAAGVERGHNCLERRFAGFGVGFDGNPASIID